MELYTESNKRNMTWGRLGLAAFSGLLATFAFTGAGKGYAAWVALVPLFLALRGMKGSEGFRIGFVFGVAHFSTLLYWLVPTMRSYGHLPIWQAAGVLLCMSAIFGVYMGVFSSAAAGLISRHGRWSPFFIAAAWVAVEFFRTSVPVIGFSWGVLGYSQINAVRLIQIADVTGVYGVSFLVVFANALLFLIACLAFKYRVGTPPLSAGELVQIGCVFVLLAAGCIGYGVFRIIKTDDDVFTEKNPNMAVIQGNIDQGVKWSPAFTGKTVEKYIDLSKASLALKPDIIIWPETAMPFHFLRDARFSGMVAKEVRKIRRDFLIGAPSVFSDNGKLSSLNSAFLVNAEGDSTARYDKVRLVPFGEYVPFGRIMSWLGINKMVRQVGDFKPGREGTVMKWREYKIGVQICFEIIFPDLSRRMAENGANVLVNMTNDAWFGKTTAPRQHFEMAVFRAVENRRSVVRCANTGISGFIDPAGRVMDETPIFTESVKAYSVPMLSFKTFYTNHGDIFAWLCAAAAAVGVLALLMRKKM